MGRFRFAAWSRPVEQAFAGRETRKTRCNQPCDRFVVVFRPGDSKSTTRVPCGSSSASQPQQALKHAEHHLASKRRPDVEVGLEGSELLSREPSPEEAAHVADVLTQLSKKLSSQDAEIFAASF